MDPVVRIAGADDIAALDRLQNLARASIVDVRGGNLRLLECRQIDNWVAVLDHPDSVVLVGTLLDVVLGVLVLDIRSETDRGVVRLAFVEEGAREVGLGDAMVEQAIAAVRRRGLHGIEAVALPGDRDTKNLYERAGLTARTITVYKSLEPGGG